MSVLWRYHNDISRVYSPNRDLLLLEHLYSLQEPRGIHTVDSLCFRLDHTRLSMYSEMMVTDIESDNQDLYVSIDGIYSSEQPPFPSSLFFLSSPGSYTDMVMKIYMYIQSSPVIT